MLTQAMGNSTLAWKEPYKDKDLVFPWLTYDPYDLMSFCTKLKLSWESKEVKTEQKNQHND